MNRPITFKHLFVVAKVVAVFAIGYGLYSQGYSDAKYDLTNNGEYQILCRVFAWQGTIDNTGKPVAISCKGQEGFFESADLIRGEDNN